MCSVIVYSTGHRWGPTSLVTPRGLKNSVPVQFCRLEPTALSDVQWVSHLLFTLAITSPWGILSSLTMLNISEHQINFSIIICPLTERALLALRPLYPRQPLPRLLVLQDIQDVFSSLDLRAAVQGSDTISSPSAGSSSPSCVVRLPRPKGRQEGQCRVSVSSCLTPTSLPTVSQAKILDAGPPSETIFDIGQV